MKKVLSSLLALTLILSSFFAITTVEASAATVPGNLLQNGDFETPTGVNDGGQGETNSNYISGGYAATPVTDPKFTKWFRIGDGNSTYHDSIQPEEGNTTNHVGKVAQTLLQGGLALENGKSYEISFRAKASTVTGNPIAQQHVGVALYDATDSIVAGASKALALKTDSITTTIVNSLNKPAAGGVTIVGTAPNNYMFAPLYQDDWYTYSLKFTLADNAITAGHSYGIVFSDDSTYSSSWYYMYIDDVSVTVPGAQIVTYTMTFDSAGGSAVAAQVIETGKTVNEPTAPTKVGYTFDGWYTDATSGTKVTFPYTMTANVTLYAHWTLIPNSSIVTFDSGGGSAVAPQSVTTGSTLSTPTAPTRSGYTFDGWYTAASGGTSVTFPYTVSANVTLYAHWTLIPIVGNMLTNGDFETDTGFTQDSILNRFPSPLYASPAWATADKFHQWFRASTGSKDIYSNIIVDPSNAQNKIARAMQTALQGVTVVGNNTYILKFTAKADYAFKKFNISFVDLTSAGTVATPTVLYPILSATGTKSYFDGTSQVVDTITPYDAPGTRILMQLDTDKWATYELTVTLGEAADSTKLCALRFGCEDYSGATGDPATAPFYMDNVSLEMPVSYTVAFDSNGGTSVASQTVNSDTAISAPTPPAKSGFAFDGWYTDATNGTKVTFPYTVSGNVTLYAHWTVASHTPGDINNDGKVDLMDITILSRYVAGWSGLSYNADALNVNGDSNVDLMDVTMLSRFVAGWNVTIR